MQKNFLPEGVEKTNYPKYNFSYLTGNSPSTIFLVGEFSCHPAVTVGQKGLGAIAKGIRTRSQIRIHPKSQGQDYNQQSQRWI